MECFLQGNPKESNCFEDPRMYGRIILKKPSRTVSTEHLFSYTNYEYMHCFIDCLPNHVSPTCFGDLTPSLGRTYVILIKKTPAFTPLLSVAQCFRFDSSDRVRRSGRLL
jgi:hypothetical protein